MSPEKPSVDDILRKYGSKIEGQITTSNIKKGNYSREYLKFKQEMEPELTRYEKWVKSLGTLVKLNVSKKDEERIKRQIEIAHLNIEPWQALTLSVMSFLAVFLIGVFISIAIVLINGSIASFPFLFFFLMVTVSLFYFILLMLILKDWQINGD